MKILYTIGTEGKIGNGLFLRNFRLMCTNDKKGKTLSIDNGEVQFSIPLEGVIEFFVDTQRPDEEC